MKTLLWLYRGLSTWSAHEESESGSSPVLTGKELERMSSEELKEAVNRVAVYARVSPEHKVRIVDALRSRGM